MKKDDLFLTLFILCAAAFAAASFALSNSFGSKGSVKAYFVNSEVLEHSIEGRERTAFDPSVLRFEGICAPFDQADNTVYIPQSCEDPDWQGRLSLTRSGGKIMIGSDHLADEDLKRESVEQGTRFRLAVVFPDSYMECSAVFTGLPAVCIDYEDGEMSAPSMCAGILPFCSTKRATG